MESEFVDQVRNDVTAYLNTQTIVGRLKIVGGASRVVGFFLLLLAIVLLACSITAFCSVAAIVWLSYYLPLWAAALIIAGIYVIFLILIIIFRKPLFINPFVRILSGMLFEKEGREIEEERLRKEAEND